MHLLIKIYTNRQRNLRERFSDCNCRLRRKEEGGIRRWKAIIGGAAVYFSVQTRSIQNKMIIEEIEEIDNDEDQQCIVLIKDSPDKGKGLFVTR